MKLIAASVLVAFAGLVGCGGDDESGSVGSESVASGPITMSSLSKKQFVQQSNAICERLADEQVAALTDYAEERPEKSEDELLPGAIEEIFVPIKRERINELRELGAPRGERKQVEKVIVAMEGALKELERDPISEGEARESQRSDSFFTRNTERSRKLAEGYGLDECLF